MWTAILGLSLASRNERPDSTTASFAGPKAAGAPGAPPAETKYAAISLFGDSESASSGLTLGVGTPTKHPANPLLVQDQPWETRIDNGYPNVVPPKAAGEPFQLWYGTCSFSCDRQLLLYVFVCSTTPTCQSICIGTKFRLKVLSRWA